MGWLDFSVNPISEKAAAMTLGLIASAKKSLSARYAVWGSALTFRRLIRVRSEYNVQQSPSDFPEKNLLKIRCKQKLISQLLGMLN